MVAVIEDDGCSTGLYLRCINLTFDFTSFIHPDPSAADRITGARSISVPDPIISLKVWYSYTGLTST